MKGNHHQIRLIPLLKRYKIFNGFCWNWMPETTSNRLFIVSSRLWKLKTLLNYFTSQVTDLKLNQFAVHSESEKTPFRKIVFIIFYWETFNNYFSGIVILLPRHVRSICKQENYDTSYTPVLVLDFVIIFWEWKEAEERKHVITSCLFWIIITEC